MDSDFLERTPTAQLLEVRRVPAPAPAPAPRRGRSLLAWTAGGLAVGLVVTLGALVVVRAVERRPYKRSSVTVVQAAPPPHETPLPEKSDDGVPTVDLASLPIVPSTHGTLRFGVASHGHRVWVDGVLAGDSTSDLSVRCGVRTVKLGSQGEERTLNVPCGGELEVR